MSVYDHVHAGSLRVADGLIKVGRASLGQVLARIDERVVEPVADGNADGVEAVGLHLGEVVLGDPGVPVALEVRVGGGLVIEGGDTVELGGRGAFEAAKDRACHPILDHEQRTQIHTSNGIVVVAVVAR